MCVDKERAKGWGMLGSAFTLPAVSASISIMRESAMMPTGSMTHTDASKAARPGGASF